MSISSHPIQKIKFFLFKFFFILFVKRFKSTETASQNQIYRISVCELLSQNFQVVERRKLEKIFSIFFFWEFYFRKIQSNIVIANYTQWQQQCSILTNILHLYTFMMWKPFHEISDSYNKFWCFQILHVITFFYLSVFTVVLLFVSTMFLKCDFGIYLVLYLIESVSSNFSSGRKILFSVIHGAYIWK